MTRRPPSLRRLALLLSLPLVLLAGMGVWVVRQERLRVEAEQQPEANRLREALLAELPEEVIPGVTDPKASALQNELAHRGYTVARWLISGTEPPLPGKSWQSYERRRQLIREGKGDEARQFLEKDFAWSWGAHTPSGTPLEPLMWRVQLELATPEKKASFALSVCHSAIQNPSAMTSRLVREALEYLPAEQRAEWEAKVAQAEEVFAFATRTGRQQAALGRLPSDFETTNSDAMRPVRGEWKDGFLVRSHENARVQVLPYDELHDLMQPLVKRFTIEREGEVALTPQIAWHGGLIHSASGTELAVGTKGAWRVWIMRPASGALEAEIARRTRFFTWVLVNVWLVVAAAMGLTWRAFKKQAELSRLQAEFVASVSHELRTPVASIGVLAERLEEGRADAAQTAEYHRFIAREGRRLAALVDNVLDFSRIERGARAYDMESADLPRLVRETAALMRPRAEEKRLTLIEEIHDVPEHLWPPVDAVAIRQALVNLLDNAIKFTPSGGTVTVQLSALNGAVMLHVRDTGIGIPPGEQRKIFERFYRVDNGLRRETTGAGIGLSIVKHIAEAHGARVTVASEAGNGAVFTLHFPPAPNPKS